MSVMILERLGTPLNNLYSNLPRLQTNNKFWYWVWLESLKCIQFLHQMQIFHRDIKPHNFALGYKKPKQQLYIFDFGLSCLKSSSDKQWKQGGPSEFIGTLEYASMNQHNRYLRPYSYCDDLESWWYAIVSLRSPLPWKDEPNRFVIENGKKNINIREMFKSGNLSSLKNIFENLYHEIQTNNQSFNYNKWLTIFNSRLN